MDILASIGQVDTTLQYIDRPTVKVVIKKANTLLLLGEGMLPGGGVEPEESDSDAITRELQEELGMTVTNVQEIGTVIQYRSLIHRKYLVNGYTAELLTAGGPTNPQNEREAQLTIQWLTLDEALAYVSASIDNMKLKSMDNAANHESKRYNLMSTLEILKHIG